MKRRGSDRGPGGGSGIAKVNVALSVIYRHITRLTQLMRARACMCVVRGGVRKAGVNVNELACTCIMSLPLLDGSISVVIFFFFGLTTALFFIGVLSAVPLLSVLHTLPSIPASLLFSSLAPCSYNLIMRPYARRPPPPFSSRCYTLRGEM